MHGYISSPVWCSYPVYCSMQMAPFDVMFIHSLIHNPTCMVSYLPPCDIWLSIYPHVTYGFLSTPMCRMASYIPPCDVWLPTHPHVTYGFLHTPMWCMASYIPPSVVWLPTYPHVMYGSARRSMCSVALLSLTNVPLLICSNRNSFITLRGRGWIPLILKINIYQIKSIF